MWKKVTEGQGAIIAAIIGGLFLCVVTIIGLSNPIIAQWAERNLFKENEATPSHPVSATSVPNSTEATTSTPMPTTQESLQPTSVSSTQNPLCDTNVLVREPTALGAEKTFIRCPVGQVEYSIQTDDLLKSIVLKCPGSKAQSIDFSLDETLSREEMLPTFHSDIFYSASGCEVHLTIANTDGNQTGYTIRQEVVGSVALSFCGDLGNDATFNARPYQYIIGDIVIDGISYTDAQGYTEEGTVAFFEREAQVYAKYGAGCWSGDASYLQRVVETEFLNGCGGEGCKTIRKVIVKADGSVSVTCYSGIDQESTCPPTAFP